LSCIFAILLAPMAHGQQSETTVTAQRLMVRSGMAVQLNAFVTQFEGEIRRNDAKLDDRMVATLSAAAKEAFQPDVLQKDITARMAKTLTLGDMRAALAWLDSDLGQRVTRAEELASTTFDLERLREFAGGLKSKPLGPKRENLLSQLSVATDAVRVAAATQEILMLGVAIGIDSLQPPERRAGEAVLRSRLREVMPPEKLRAALAQDMPLLSAYMYRGVPDADLIGYVDFLKSAPGKRYQDGTIAAFMEGLARASMRMGEVAARRREEATLTRQPEARLQTTLFYPA